MDLLPAEMVGLILGHCEHSALKNLRRVNKDLSQTCTPRVFEEFYMGFFKQSLKKL